MNAGWGADGASATAARSGHGRRTGCAPGRRAPNVCGLVPAAAAAGRGLPVAGEDLGVAADRRRRARRGSCSGRGVRRGGRQGRTTESSSQVSPHESSAARRSPAQSTPPGWDTDDGHQVDPRCSTASGAGERPRPTGPLVRRVRPRRSLVRRPLQPAAGTADQGDAARTVAGRGPERPGLDGGDRARGHAAGATLTSDPSLQRSSRRSGASEDQSASGLDWQPVSELRKSDPPPRGRPSAGA